VSSLRLPHLNYLARLRLIYTDDTLPDIFIFWKCNIFFTITKWLFS